MKVDPKTLVFLKQLGLVTGAALLLMVILSAVQRKQNADSIDLQIQIEALEGEQLITDKDVRNSIQRRFGHNLNGIPIGNLDLKEVEKVLESDPFVYDADVYVDAIHKVKVRIWQREPLLRVIDRNGSQYYLDIEGEKLPLSPNYTARVLVASGNIKDYEADYLENEKSDLNQLFKVAIAVYKDEFLKAQTEQLYINAKRDLLLIPKVGDHKIVLGNALELEQKLEKLKLFYHEGLPYKGWQTYKTINLKYEDQIVCTKK
ncbi:MAG: cell division protein FtsQ [Bacteroidota bacterium]